MGESAINFLLFQWISSTLIVIISAFMKNGYLFTLGCVGLADYWLTIYAHKK